MIPIFLLAILSNVKSSLPDLTNTPVLSANTTLEKSTIFMRDNEIVVDPHSMSALPSTIASNRVLTSTGIHFVARVMFSCSWSDAAMRSQSSIV